MGNRLPQAVRAKFRDMLETGVTVPSLSHYVTCETFGGKGRRQLLIVS